MASEGRKEWGITVSPYAKNTVNPIRAIVDNLQIPKNPPKRCVCCVRVGVMCCLRCVCACDATARRAHACAASFE